MLILLTPSIKVIEYSYILYNSYLYDVHTKKERPK
jgi:hypothetical protein